MSKYFLETWHQDKTFYLFCLNHKNPKNTKTLKHTIKTYEQYEKTIKYYNDNGFSIYFTPNTFKEDAKGRNREEVDEITAIWFDIDTPDTSAQIYSQIITAFGIPTYKIETSPKKMQILYRLNKPIKNTDRNRFIIETTLRILVKHFGTDESTVGVNQNLRLPLTKNCKYEGVTSFVEMSTDNTFDLKPFIAYANKVKQNSVYMGVKASKASNKAIKPIDDVVYQVDEFTGLTPKLESSFGFFYHKKVSKDFSRAELPYIKTREKAGVSFEVIWAELMELRKVFNNPLKRDYATHYNDRENKYLEYQSERRN